jgi:hypothetical protein
VPSSQVVLPMGTMQQQVRDAPADAAVFLSSVMLTASTRPAAVCRQGIVTPESAYRVPMFGHSQVPKGLWGSSSSFTTDSASSKGESNMPSASCLASWLRYSCLHVNFYSKTAAVDMAPVLEDTAGIGAMSCCIVDAVGASTDTRMGCVGTQVATMVVVWPPCGSGTSRQYGSGTSRQGSGWPLMSGTGLCQGCCKHGHARPLRQQQHGAL